MGLINYLPFQLAIRSIAILVIKTFAQYLIFLFRFGIDIFVVGERIIIEILFINFTDRTHHWIQIFKEIFIVFTLLIYFGIHNEGFITTIVCLRPIADVERKVICILSFTSRMHLKRSVIYLPSSAFILIIDKWCTFLSIENWLLFSKIEIVMKIFSFVILSSNWSKMVEGQLAI